MRPFLTLHHPADARRYYEQGLWCNDTFYSLLSEHANVRPQAAALQDGRRTVTWSELLLCVDGVASSLREYGLVGGDRVSIWMSNCIPHKGPLRAEGVRTGSEALPRIDEKSVFGVNPVRKTVTMPESVLR